MKEIDINIEGYNVNGICIGCLNYDRKMFYYSDVKECLKILGDIDVPDGLTIQMCWECVASVKRVMRFQDQVLKSYEVLINYSKEYPFLNSPSDFTKHSVTYLQVTSLEDGETFIHNDDVEDQDVKAEIKKEFSETSDLLKYESDAYDGAEEINFSDGIHDDQNMSSDDDLELSKVKEKKEKQRKEKKRKKNSRDKSKKDKNYKDPKKKLKNLPEELVDIYTMTDEDMWAVRAEDQNHKWFEHVRYKCTSCLLTFNTEKLMNEHMKAKHKMKGADCHHCEVCKSYFLTKDHLSAHRELHLTAFKCKICDIKTTVRAIIHQHLKVHQEMTESFVCKECKKSFSTKSKLVYHTNKYHKEKLQCDCCGKVFASKMTLKYHLKLLNQKKEDRPKEKLYLPCKGCDKVFYSKKSYRAHVVIHNGIKYPCPICGKLFQWKRNLARHTRNHREKDAGTLHECRECGKTFSSKDCYNNHMRLSKMHVPEEAYVHECNYCGKKFATKWCMVDHIDWDHLKIIKYQCSVCFKAFKTAKIMVAHMSNIHEGKKSKEPDGEHLCEVCGKSYKSVKRLKGHVWAMHTNRSSTKSYKCKLCPATFAWQTSIYKHARAAHDTRRPKQNRSSQSTKKQEPYTDIEPIARMQYFQPNTLMQNAVLIPPNPTSIV